jgi:hypothetical protein
MGQVISLQQMVNTRKNAKHELLISSTLRSSESVPMLASPPLLEPVINGRNHA